ncbi:MAG: cardiolipin synthase [Gammaproteobacteria bacterium]|nr:cardiolipin synthase [Gammaproteobacteria bacterium]
MTGLELLPVFLAALNVAMVLIGVYNVLYHPREPRAMLAWILLFLLLPVVGVVLFFLMSDPKRRRNRRRLARHRQRLNPTLWRVLHEAQRDFSPQAGPHELPSALIKFVRLATRINDREPPTIGNAVEIYHDRAADSWRALLNAVAGARHHVHVEYFIFRADTTGRKLAALLLEKAREGVKCRLLLDFMGSWRFPAGLARELRAGGVEVVYYMPPLPWLGKRWRLRVNLRNHRKIAVIDGRVAFTGSQNIGDEYLDASHPLGTRIDTQLRITGPAVYKFQEVFIEDWHLSTGEDLFAEAYFPPPATADGPGEIVQVIPSGPDYDTRIMHHLLIAAIAAAEDSVCIATPYFVPDTTMVLTLEAAAFRGVRIRILVPAHSDHVIALWAGRSYYEEMVNAGVGIYEHVGSFLHSKVAIIDEHWAMVGSANMDERSFRLNFEITTVLYSTGAVTELQQAFEGLFATASPLQNPAPRTRLERLRLGLARLFGPIY